MLAGRMESSSPSSITFSSFFSIASSSFFHLRTELNWGLEFARQELYHWAKAPTCFRCLNFSLFICTCMFVCVECLWGMCMNHGWGGQRASSAFACWIISFAPDVPNFKISPIFLKCTSAKKLLPENSLNDIHSSNLCYS